MKKLCILLLCIISANTFASVTAIGKVKRIYPAYRSGVSEGVVYFKLQSPQCAFKNYVYFELDNLGKSWYSLLLAASNSGKPVKVSLVKCPITANEKIRYIYQDFS
jgi:hypothetical protein